MSDSKDLGQPGMQEINDTVIEVFPEPEPTPTEAKVVGGDCTTVAPKDEIETTAGYVESSLEPKRQGSFSISKFNDSQIIEISSPIEIKPPSADPVSLYSSPVEVGMLKSAVVQSEHISKPDGNPVNPAPVLEDMVGESSVGVELGFEKGNQEINPKSSQQKDYDVNISDKQEDDDGTISVDTPIENSIPLMNSGISVDLDLVVDLGLKGSAKAISPDVQISELSESDPLIDAKSEIGFTVEQNEVDSEFVGSPEIINPKPPLEREKSLYHPGVPSPVPNYALPTELFYDQGSYPVSENSIYPAGVVNQPLDYPILPGNPAIFPIVSETEQIKQLQLVISQQEIEIKRLNQANLNWEAKYKTLSRQYWASSGPGGAKKSRQTELERLAEDIVQRESPVLSKHATRSKRHQNLVVSTRAREREKRSPDGPSSNEQRHSRKRKDQLEHSFRAVDKFPAIGAIGSAPPVLESNMETSDEDDESWTLFTDLIQKRLKIQKFPPEYYQFLKRFKSENEISKARSKDGKSLRFHVPDRYVSEFLTDFQKRFLRSPNSSTGDSVSFTETKSLLSGDVRMESDIEILSSDRDSVDDDTQTEESSPKVASLKQSGRKVTNQELKEPSKFKDGQEDKKVSTRSQRNSSTGIRYQIWKDVVKENFPAYKFSIDSETQMLAKIREYLSAYCEQNKIDPRTLLPSGHLKDQYLIPSEATSSFMQWFKVQAKDDFGSDKRRKRRPSTSSTQDNEHYPLPMSIPKNPNYTLKPIRLFHSFKLGISPILRKLCFRKFEYGYKLSSRMNFVTA